MTRWFAESCRDASKVVVAGRGLEDSLLNMRVRLTMSLGFGC